MKITLLERTPGNWRLRIETKDDYGERVFRYETVRGTRDAAEGRRAELLAGFPKSATEFDLVSTYITQWLADRLAFGHISKSSWTAYTYLFTPALKIIGTKQLSALTSADVQQLYRVFARDFGANRTRDLAVQLRKATREAVQAGTLTRDPAANIEPPRGQKVLKDTTLGRDEIARLIEASKKWGDFGSIVRFAIATGCRRGEICGLQWRDVNLDTGVIQIARNVVQGIRETRTAPTKTKSGTRRVTLPESLIAELRERKGTAAPTAWVFGDHLGKCRRPAWITKTADDKFPKIGLGEFTFHDLRHAHATYLLQQRLPLKAISQRLGHSDVRITLGTYAHVMPGDDESLASAINTVL